MMGKITLFCAGASNREVYPGRNVEGILLPTPTICKTESSLEQHQKFLDNAQPKYFMLDSGGFQLLVAEDAGKNIKFSDNSPLVWTDKEINLTPDHIVKLAASLKRRPDIMVGLDFPVRKIADPEEQKKEFLHKLGPNIAWTQQMSVLRQKYGLYDTRFFVPIQCYTLPQFESFFQAINGCTYDGISMPVRNMSPVQKILFLAKFYTLGIKQVHLLGATSLTDIVLASYFARHYFDWVSLDSQTWRIFAEHSAYLNPFDLKKHYIGSGVIINGDIPTPCRCPWCYGKTFPKIKNMPYTDRFRFLCRHNYWVTNNIVNEVYEHASSLNRLDAFLKSRCRKYAKYRPLIEGLRLFETLKGGEISELEQALTLIQ